MANHYEEAMERVQPRVQGEVVSWQCRKCLTLYNRQSKAEGCKCEPDQQATTATALDVQIAGSHYKTKAIQPVEFIHANGLNFLEGCIVKRITRWRDKPAEDRFADLHKIKHEIDLLIQLEGGK